MQLGVRAHDFGKLPLEVMADRIAGHGLSCIQLAPPKALAGFDSDAADRLTPEFAAQVREACGRRGIHIAVLGCYINLGDRDAAQHRPQLERFKRYLRVAAAFGCRVVGTETGSVNSDFSWHPDNLGEAAFRTVLTSVRELAREAEKSGAVVGIEGVERYVISSPRRLKRLVDETASPSLQVILDPVNLLSLKNHAAQDEILEEALTLLGDRIGIVHAKDFTVADGQFRELPAGQGQLHYPRLLRWIKEHRPDIDVLLENTQPASIADTVAFMRAAYAAA